MKIIVNADDLGIGLAENYETFRLMTAGHITSATLLANAPYFEEAARRIQDFPQVSFGVHLNVTQFSPLTQQKDLFPIINERGEFAGNIRKVHISRRLGDAIFREWSAQVEKLFKAGIRVSHFDSHHHVHTMPAIFPTLVRLCRRFGVNKIRTTMSIYRADEAPSPFLRAGKSIWQFAVRRVCRLQTTDGFTSLQIFLQRNRVCRQRGFTLELMVHPGGGGFEEETRLLGTEWWKPLGYRADDIITYREL